MLPLKELEPENQQEYSEENVLRKNIIDNNKNGYIIKNRNEEEYIEKIEKVINDSKLRNELGIEAKNKANEFSKEKIVNIWEKILK